MAKQSHSAGEHQTTSTPKVTADPLAPLSPDGPDFAIKNARAKAIIMSTLVPGSEPWKIAEPLERASDIWGALEQRYSSRLKLNSQPQQPGPASQSDFVDDWVQGKPVDQHRNTKPSSSKNSSKSSCSSTDASEPLVRNTSRSRTATHSPSGMQPEEREKTSQTWEQGGVHASAAASEESDKRRKEAQAAAAKVLMEHMPNRDQRFLWALLHGGKDEIMAWFNGTDDKRP